MQALIALAKELKYPGAAKLWQAAREADINVTKAQVRDLLATQGQKQIYRPVPPSKGKTVAEAPEFRYMADLIDYKNNPSKGFSVVLVIQDVFSRQVWARPAPNKTPVAIARVMQPMLEAMPPVKFLTTDAGNEFKKEVDELLEDKQITHRTRTDKNDTNLLAVIDRAIQTIKTKLAEEAKDGSEWADDLAGVVAAYNKTPHEAVHGRPDKVKNNEIKEFLVLADNADKAQHNNQLLAARKKALEKTGTFRQPKGNLVKTFKRGFKATFGGTQKVERIQGSTVHIRGGGTVDIKRIMAVDQNSSEVPVTFGEFSQRDENKRKKTVDFITSLQEWIDKSGGDKKKSMVKAAEFLKERWGEERYQQILDSVYGNLADIIRLWPTLQVVDNGYYVKAV